MKLDLHIHSKNSDGTLSPEEIFKVANKSDIRAISITDHDYIEDYSELANRYGILAIPGIEFNTSYEKMHILGYDIKDIERVKKLMHELLRHNEDVCLKVIEMLRLDSFDISKDKVISFCKENNLNHVFINKKLIVKYLIYKGYSSNVKETYDSLIGRNAPYYYGIHKLTPKEVIELINNTGGISVWAHPELMKLNNYLVVDKLKSYGLNGIEIMKRKKDKERKYYELRALDENFITTYGSDFHSEQDEMGVLVDGEKAKILIKQLGGKIC